MLEIRPYSLQGDYTQTQQQLEALREATWLYRQVQRDGWWDRLRARLTRQCRALYDLAALEGSGKIFRRYYAGVQQVPIRQIRGSEGRTGEFDTTFRPLRAHTGSRWQRVAAAWLAGDPMPPVELIQVGEMYYVRDGHHRVSVARALNVTHIEAEVTVWDPAHICTDSPAPAYAL
jgi:hypothetical protein